jgi:maleylpyruvate isomerase
MDHSARDLAGATAAHRFLEASIEALDAAAAAQPSALPGWTVAHVLTHLARNADSHLGMLEAAGRGEPAVQYPGGRAQRAADIEAGAHRPADQLTADVRASNAALEAAWATATARTWGAVGETATGPVPLHDLPFRRWRETCVHHADLGLGFTWADWPSAYVRADLQRMTMLWNARQPMGLTGLPAAALAASDAHRLAWLMGRAAIEGLGAAELMA